jgi:hypothetical protein
VATTIYPVPMTADIDEVKIVDDITTTNVSFANDVLPMFARRGCTACHATSATIGSDAGGLALDGPPATAYWAATPHSTLLANAPLWIINSPAGSHPAVFVNDEDPDYALLSSWLDAGMPNN